MKKLLNVLIISLLLTSCKVFQPQVIYVTKDSIITKVEYIIKDSIITIPGDTIRFQIPCDKDTVFIYRSKSSSSMVQVNKGVVTVQNNCDEKDLIISKLQSKLDKIQYSSSDSSRVEIKTVKHIPTIYKVYSWGFWILAAAIAALLYFNQNLWFFIATTVASLFKSSKKK